MRMHIAIDLTALLPEATGIDNYLIGLVSSLGLVDRENLYKIIINREDRPLFEGMLPPNFSVAPLSMRMRAARLFCQQILVPVIARKWRADVVHSPSFISPVWQGAERHVLTIHDMTFFSLPSCHIPLRRSAPFKQAVVNSIRRARTIFVPSRFTMGQIMHYIPETDAGKIRVVPHGLNEEFRVYRETDVQARISRLGLPAPYILYVGTIEPRKNITTLLSAYRLLIRKRTSVPSLVLAGRLGWDYQPLISELSTPDLSGRVHRTGYVSNHDLPWVYSGASLFVYPSLQEGFGFPPLEAMACGVPTISSRSSSLEENMNGAAELIDPCNAEALAEAMDRMLRDKALRQSRRKAGLVCASRYRWEKTARMMLQCYRETVESTAGR